MQKARKPGAGMMLDLPGKCRVLQHYLVTLELGEVACEMECISGDTVVADLGGGRGKIGSKLHSTPNVVGFSARNGGGCTLLWIWNSAKHLSRASTGLTVAFQTHPESLSYP